MKGYRSLGYGFVAECCSSSQNALAIAECNSGFKPVYWCMDEKVTRIEDGEQYCFVDSDRIVHQIWNENSCPGEVRRIPLVFRVDVKETGNYKVTLTVKGNKGTTMIFLGHRRLYRIGEIREDFTETYYVNVSEIIPSGYKEVCCDLNISVGILGERPALSQIEIEKVDCPTVFLLGDSTMMDQNTEYPYAPGTSYSGWGQMLPAFVKGKVAIANHAHSGLNTESMRNEGYYEIARKQMKQGDYCLIQFGHNDQKQARLGANQGYRENLIRYIEEIREKNAIPILVTPVARNS